MAAAIVAPFATYYVAHERWLYASLMVGVMTNCLTVAAFAAVAIQKHEKGLGGLQFYRDAELRARIVAEQPHLSRETLILGTTVLLPLCIPAAVLYDVASKGWGSGDNR